MSKSCSDISATQMRYICYADAIVFCCCMSGIRAKGVPEKQNCFLGKRSHSGAKKLFVIPHGKRKAELVVTSDILLRNTIYFPAGNAKVCSFGAIIIYVKPTFKAHIKLPKAYHLRDKLQDLSHIARKHIARHHKLRLTLSVRCHEKLFCSAVAPLSQKATLPFGSPLVSISRQRS